MRFAQMDGKPTVEIFLRATNNNLRQICRVNRFRFGLDFERKKGCNTKRSERSSLKKTLKFGPNRFLILLKKKMARPGPLFLWQINLPSFFSSIKKCREKVFASHSRHLTVRVLLDVVAPRRFSENSVLAQSLVENLPQVFFRQVRCFFLKTQTYKKIAVKNNDL